ncbi:MBL fold metallo-hydrolase [Pseudonocardia adelaidensis]|uniref:MBL fold metallo-hydrolase n=1 Tax=Pseudonocardia adelaidensis TaxID=648754 RepID=A0ABP9PBN2_9PSEU
MDERLRRPSGIRSLTIGDTTLSYVPDGAVQLSPRGWLPDTTDEVWAKHPEYLDDSGHLVAGVGGLLVERGGRALLIDAGFGPQAAPAQPGNPYGAIHGGALLENLATLGRRPADIEAVAITHLHVDHVGWAREFTGGSLVSEPEWAQRHLAVEQGTSRELLDALRPTVRTVTDGEEIFPGVRAMLTPGHTAGHTTYVITAGEHRVIAFGDAFHSPLQMEHPEWWAAPDHDRGRSTHFRRALVEELSRPRTIGFGVHFADVAFGHVHSGDDGPAWRPVDD